MIMLEFYVLSSVATIGVCESGVCVRVFVFVHTGQNVLFT